MVLYKEIIQGESDSFQKLLPETGEHYRRRGPQDFATNKEVAHVLKEKCPLSIVYALSVKPSQV